jgi:hypothetical protein
MRVMADQRALFESMHKVELPDAKMITSKRQRWILFLLVAFFVFATGVYATREHVVHPTGATTVVAHWRSFWSTHPQPFGVRANQLNARAPNALPPGAGRNLGHQP